MGITMEQRPHYIYALIDPITKEVGYVGMSALLRKRYLDHIYCSTHGQPTEYKKRWVRGLESRNTTQMFHV